MTAAGATRPEKVFINACGLVLQEMEESIPEGVDAREWRAFSLDLLVRSVFLRLASAKQDGGEAPDVVELRPPLLEGIMAKGYSGEYGRKGEADPYGVMHRLSPISDHLQAAAERAAAVTVELRGVLGPDSPLWRYRFSLSDDGDGALGPGVLASMVEQFGGDRRGRGAYYTPEPVVDVICREVLALRLPELRAVLLGDSEGPSPEELRSEAIRKLRGMRILDPACGGGAFLVGMRKVLREVYRSLEAEEEIGNLYGVDLDPQAAAVTRMRLWLEGGSGRMGGKSAEVLAANIAAGDSIADGTEGPGDRKWDIIVTNPPYGVKASFRDRDRIMGASSNGHRSRDSYGLFLARVPEMLAEDGVAGLVVADTWRTIKSHRALRERLLGRVRLVHIVDLPARTFAATVGAEVVILMNRPAGDERVRAADLRHSHDRSGGELRQVLMNRKVSDRLPVYEYEQRLCSRHRSRPVFVASPSLFERMINPSLVRLGEIAEIRHGLTTGAVRRFVYAQEGIGRGFRRADPGMIVSAEGLETLSEQERRNGFEEGRFDGRFLVPYDKGGASEADRGWLPCYRTPTAFYIDWRMTTVEEMKRLPGFRHDGRQYYFRRGITFSHTGYYAPTFRVGSGGVFDTAGSTLFSRGWDLHLLLALLNSKTVRYLFKNFINHSVNTSEGPLKEIPLPDRGRIGGTDVDLIELVRQIMLRQEEDRYYPYLQWEQMDIDRIVYDLYDLSADERAEVERWHIRRYPRLFVR